MKIKKKKNRRLTLKQGLSLMHLKEIGGEYIEVAFSGSGDDGAIDDITLYNHLENDIKFELKSSEIEDLFYECIDEKAQYEGDWVNNNGGYGTLSINLKDNTYDLDISFYTTYDCGWNNQRFI
jgi:hypothetical protein